MKKIDISKLSDRLFDNIDKIGKLPQLYRVLISLCVLAALIGPFVYFSFLPKLNKLDELNKESETLESRLARTKAKANQLKHYQDRLKAAEIEFKIVKKRLPEKQEIPSLLESVSRSGRDAGLEFILFEPQAERNKDFYAEIPVLIKVTGNYLNVALFFDKVSRLSRIVTIDNIKMATIKGTDNLETSCTAITYRFVEKKPKKTS